MEISTLGFIGQAIIWIAIGFMIRTAFIKKENK